MKMRFFQLLAVLLPVCFSACGYHVGGLKNKRMQGMDTFCINMFENHTTYADVSRQMTTALADALQRDGTFRLVTRSRSDFYITGAVTQVVASSLRTDSWDSYLSKEVGLTVWVSYRVIDSKTQETVIQASTSVSSSYFTEIGNTQSSRDAALSYATRKAANNIVDSLTLP